MSPPTSGLQIPALSNEGVEEVADLVARVGRMTDAGEIRRELRIHTWTRVLDILASARVFDAALVRWGARSPGGASALLSNPHLTHPGLRRLLVGEALRFHGTRGRNRDFPSAVWTSWAWLEFADVLGSQHTKEAPIVRQGDLKRLMRKWLPARFTPGWWRLALRVLVSKKEDVERSQAAAIGCLIKMCAHFPGLMGPLATRIGRSMSEGNASAHVATLVKCPGIPEALAEELLVRYGRFRHVRRAAAEQSEVRGIPFVQDLLRADRQESVERFVTLDMEGPALNERIRLWAAGRVEDLLWVLEHAEFRHAASLDRDTVVRLLTHSDPDVRRHGLALLPRCGEAVADAANVA